MTGTGRSDGRGIAEVLAESGAFVVVNELCADRATETIESIERAGGRATANALALGLMANVAQGGDMDAGGDIDLAFRRMVAGIPVGRLGEPREVGAAAALLASDDAGFITGQVIHINGGARFGR